MKNVVSDLMYLIDLGKPSVIQAKQDPVPESLFELYCESFNQTEIESQKEDTLPKTRPKSAAKLGTDKPLAELTDVLGPEGDEDGINQPLEEEALRQALSDHDEEAWKRIRPIFIQLMNEFLDYNGISMNCICAQDQGFAVGLSGYGLLCLYREKEGVYFMESCSRIQNRDVQSIHCISNSNDNSHVAVVAKVRRKF